MELRAVGRKTSPRSSALLRPVAIRHRSTASCRASATIAFLRAAPEVLTTPRPSTLCQRCIPRYWGWKITTEAAEGTREAGGRASTPGELDHQPAQARAAMFGDRTQMAFLSAAAFARTEPEVVADLPAVFEALRVDEFARDQLVTKLAFTNEELLRSGRGQGRFQTSPARVRSLR